MVVVTAPGPSGVVDRIRDAGLQAEGGFTLEAALGQLAGASRRRERHDRDLWASIHTVPIRSGALTALVSASGVVDFPDALGPHDGYWWDVRRLSAWGWTAGSVTVYLNDATGSGEPLAVFSSTGQYTWGKAQMPLAPRDRLVVVAAGVTGNVYVAGSAVEVLAPSWPEYIA